MFWSFTGGKSRSLAGIREFGTKDCWNLRQLESAIEQQFATFGGDDLYPDSSAKAAALAFSLVKNHPFIDGNKRTGHYAMEGFLVTNGFEVSADTDAQEKIILGLAASEVGREDFHDWLRAHVVPVVGEV